ncbi:MAG: DHH family phosphoesterase, partial [Cyclobacteriaceae bacterium]
TKVLIDHHQEPEDFADFVSWSTKAAATAELVYMLIRDMGEESLVDPDIADCLYAGIMTDTGSFKHPNTTRNVHLITADLMERGADVSRVAKLVYDTNSQDRIRFLGYALNEKLTVLPEYRTAYFAITAEELKRFKSQTGDTEGLVNYALGIEGITLAAVIIDRTEAVKLSFRSVGTFSVNIFARNHFDGGGHKNAAGGKSDLDLDQTVQKFEGLLEEYKDQLLENGKPINEHV